MKAFQRNSKAELGRAWNLIEPVALVALGAFVACAFVFPAPENVAVDWVGVREFVAPLLATFLGATLAFWLGSIGERRRQLEANLAAVHMLLFQFVRMLNLVKNLQATYIDPVREQPGRFLSIPAVLPVDSRDFRVDFSPVSFMFHQHANLLGDLSIAERNFVSTAEILRERTQFLLGVIQPALKNAGLPGEFQATEDELSQLLGGGNLKEIRHLTDQLIDSVDSSAKRLKEVIDELSDAIRLYFPEQKIRVTTD